MPAVEVGALACIAAEHDKQKAMHVRFCDRLPKEVTDLRPRYVASVEEAGLGLIQHHPYSFTLRGSEARGAVSTNTVTHLIEGDNARCRL